MAKSFIGNVSIVVNSKGEVALVKSDTGKFSNKNAPQLVARLAEVVKKEKLPLSKWALFAPEGTEGKTPVLLANKFGQPYIAYLSPQVKAASKTRILD